MSIQKNNYEKYVKKEFHNHIAELLISYGCHELCLSPYLEIEWVERYPDFKWIWGTNQENQYGYEYGRTLGKKDNFNISWVRKYPDKPWDFYHDISENCNLTPKWIHEYPDENWNWYAIGNNFNFKIEWLDELKNEIKSEFWESISMNYNFNIDWIKRYPWGEWLWENINKNYRFVQNFTIEYYEDFPEADWNWDLICIICRNFDIKWIQKYPRIPWNFRALSKNKNLTLEWLNIFPYPYFQVTFTQDTYYKNKEWDLFYLNKEKNIIYNKFNNSFSYCNKPILEDELSDTETETTSIDSASTTYIYSEIDNIENRDIINNYRSQIQLSDFDTLICSRYYDKYYQKFKIQKYREWTAVEKIKKWWLRIYYSPYTKIGQKMINRKYDEQFVDI